MESFLESVPGLRQEITRFETPIARVPPASSEFVQEPSSLESESVSQAESPPESVEPPEQYVVVCGM